MDTLKPTEPETVWPKKRPSRSQRLVHTGTRTDKDPALLTCHGSCGKESIKWTWHYMVGAASFQCKGCGTNRRWGLGFSY